jgi:hypothetical protein
VGYRVLVPAHSIQRDPEQMKGVGVVGNRFKNSPEASLGLGKTARLVAVESPQHGFDKASAGVSTRRGVPGLLLPGEPAPFRPVHAGVSTSS